MSRADACLGLPSWLVRWCARQLGAPPVALLLRTEHVSAVFGLRLADGRLVVVKARREDMSRAAACVAGQAALARAGFRCPGPLTEVTRVGQLAVHAEEWLPGGELLRGDSADVARRYATVYALLMAALAGVDVPPPLPSPQWLGWDHVGPGPWPPIKDFDRRDQSAVPDFVVTTAIRATRRLRQSRDLPRVLGHADFEAQNLRWKGRTLWAVYDWDSLAQMPESVLVGSAAGVFASAEVPTLAPIDSSAAFIQTYQETRDRAFSAAETELAWAASLWTTTHNARAEALLGRPPVATTALLAQAAERLTRAQALAPALGVGVVERPRRVGHDAERQSGRVTHYPPVLDLLDPLRAEGFQARDLGLQVVGVDVKVHTRRSLARALHEHPRLLPVQLGPVVVRLAFDGRERPTDCRSPEVQLTVMILLRYVDDHHGQSAVMAHEELT